MAQIESKRQVLEDGDEALLGEAKIEDGEEFASLDEEKKLDSTAPAAKADDTATPDEDELPSDLKGKSPAQLAKMYQDAQKLIGRQGSELGEFRRKADLLIQASLAKLTQGSAPAKKEDKPAELDDSEFFTKPKDAVLRMIEDSPIIREIRATLGKAAQDQAVSRATGATERFNQAHPDAGEILQNPEFRKWVSASRVRTDLLKRAHQQFDFDAGDEVFGTWKALQGVAKPNPAASDAAATEAARALAKRKAALKAAATPTGGNAAPGAGGTKKIYRRADVLKLMEEDPDRYEQLAPEIEKAYAEGRVR